MIHKMHGYDLYKIVAKLTAYENIYSIVEIIVKSITGNLV
jgi:hypothetical protein